MWGVSLWIHLVSKNIIFIFFLPFLYLLYWDFCRSLLKKESYGSPLEQHLSEYLVICKMTSNTLLCVFILDACLIGVSVFFHWMILEQEGRMRTHWRTYIWPHVEFTFLALRNISDKVQSWTLWPDFLWCQIHTDCMWYFFFFTLQIWVVILFISAHKICQPNT